MGISSFVRRRASVFEILQFITNTEGVWPAGASNGYLRGGDCRLGR